VAQTLAQLIKGVNLASAPANSFTIDSSGRCGIGATPSAKLHVNTGTNENLWVGSLGGSGAGVYLASVNDSGSANTPMQIGSASVINFAINGTEAARIDSSRRLLLGTSTSRSWSGISSQFQIENTGSGSIASQSIIANTADTLGGFLLLGKSRGTSLGSNTVVQNNDIIGKITFSGADGSALIQGAAIAAEVDGTPGANDMPGRLVFSTTADGASSPTERMRIAQNGVITTTATASDVFGFVIATNSGNQYNLHLTKTADQNTINEDYIRGTGGATVRFAVKGNGGLYNYQANNTNLSDRNTKKDISPASDTWDCIKEWEIVNYRYKDQPDDADLNLGVIAQQVAESCPEVITVFEEAKDDQPEKLGVKEQQMYWMAIKALQEAQVRIEQLEAKVAALESA